MQAYTHFQSVFDVSPRRDLDNPWTALVGEVRAWIKRKENSQPGSEFFVGGRWTSPSRAVVETRALAGDGPTPEMWAVRYEHRDAQVISRRWVTNVGVAEIGQREWRVAIVLLHHLRAGYVGRELRIPQPLSPRFVTRLLDSAHWIGRVGSVRLTGTPMSVEVGKGAEFVALLTDPRRLVPIVLVSRDRKTSQPRLDPATLSRALAGTTVVHVCESPECDEEMEYLLPRPFRCPNGTVRIYAPGVELANNWTSSRHRFFTSQDIDEQGCDEVAGQIVRALTRTGVWSGLQSSIMSIDDIDARMRERRLNELRTGGAQSLMQQKEWLELFGAENEALVKEKRQLSSRLEAAETQSRERDDKVARLEYEIGEARTLASRAATQAGAERRALEAVLGLEKWPQTPVAVARLTEAISGGRLVFTEGAIKSLTKSDFIKCDEACSVIWRCLRSMTTELFDLVMKDLSAQQVADEFGSRTIFELTWTEGKQTKRDRRLMAKRTIKYGGRQLDITPHVKWGNEPPRLLRIHFFVDREQKSLVIGHCGDHLDTYGTRRRK